MTGISLVVGLGNPGSRYAETRHNAGFWFLDYLAGKYLLSFKSEPKFQAQAAVGTVAGRRVRFLRPDTFMNHSGHSVGPFARYFDIEPEEILLIHDELDLPPGVVRLKKGGGHGGHNGLRDSASHLGTADFVRLRVGIGHPGQSSEVVSYVLGKPSAEDRDKIVESITVAGALFDRIVEGDFQGAMNQLHSTPARTEDRG